MEHCQYLVDGQPEGADLTGWIEWAESIDGQPCGESGLEWENQAGQYDFPLYSEERIRNVVEKVINKDRPKGECIDAYYLIRAFTEFKEELFEAKPDEEDKWLIFKETERKPKTKVYSVISKCSDSELGKIKWHPSWRHYCFFPTIEFETVHSDRCLLTISKFISDLNQKHKQGR